MKRTKEDYEKVKEIEQKPAEKRTLQEKVYLHNFWRSINYIKMQSVA